MKSSYPKTNDHRLIGHISRHFKIAPTDTLQELFSEVDAVVPNLPFSFREVLVVYETFPVFGEFMFPKRNSFIWQLIEQTEAVMLLTDGMVSGKDSLFICEPSTFEHVNSQVSHTISKLRRPSLCVNTNINSAALLYPISSL